jgi:hypothetical protein
MGNVLSSDFSQPKLLHFLFWLARTRLGPAPLPVQGNKGFGASRRIPTRFQNRLPNSGSWVLDSRDMDPLDLTTHPPRSPYQKMEGLFMLPRTIDKLRAQLPGGQIGKYTVRGSSSLLPGLSLVLLDGIGVTEERLFGVVREASTEDEISDWLPRNADLSDIESLNAKLLGRRIEDVQAVIPLAVIAKVYPFLANLAKTTPMFEVLLQDDRLMFPDHFQLG